MRKFFQLVLIATSISAVAGVASAESTAWPGSQSKPNSISSIDLVTVSEPGVRHKCRVHEITPETITCGVGMLREAVVYKRDNVAALIVPPSHTLRTTGIIELIAGAACLAGSFFVSAGAVVILMEVVGGLSTFIGQFNVIFDDGPTHDELIYQRPYTPLTVGLR